VFPYLALLQSGHTKSDAIEAGGVKLPFFDSSMSCADESSARWQVLQKILWMAFRPKGFPNSAVRNSLIHKILHMMPNTLDSVQPEAALDLVVEKKELRDVPFVRVYFQISDLRFRNEHVQESQQIDG
jgi:hypothetical protein